MHLLLVKTSSLGDVVHNLPVVSDLLRAFPEAQIDWCVEEAFADIPRLHPGVHDVLPVAIRRWRRALTQCSTWHEMAAFKRRLQQTRYDAVLDTQGLLKSGLITWLAEGERHGYAREVAREPLAACCYHHTYVIPPNAHAVERNRWLAAAAFDYPVDWPLDYGIRAMPQPFDWLSASRYAVLLTATSRDDKLWEEDRWTALGNALAAQGLISVLPAGSARERERAERIAARIASAVVVPPLGIAALASLLGGAALTVGVDTGLVHLAAALGTPTIALYTATDPALTGVLATGFFRNLGQTGQAPTVEAVLTASLQALRA